MDFNKTEMNAVESAVQVQEQERNDATELQSLQLAFVGGGIADVIGA